MEPNPYLICSSLLFTIPMTMSAYHKQWIIYFTMMFITLASSLYHATKNKYLLIIDYTACYTMVYVLYRESYQINKLTEFSFGCGASALLFWGGYSIKRFVFSPNKLEKNISHVSLHLIVIISAMRVSYLVNENTLIQNEN